MKELHTVLIVCLAMYKYRTMYFSVTNNISLDVTFTFDQPMYIVTEGSGNATVCVNKNGDSAITLQIEITGGM